MTVGPEVGGSPVEPLKAELTTPGTFNLVVVPTFRFWLLAAAYVVLALVVIVLARRSSILRAPVLTGQVVPAHDRPYSLGRTQMVTWFMVVLAAYLFLGFITDDWTQCPAARAVARNCSVSRRTQASIGASVDEVT